MSRGRAVAALQNMRKALHQMDDVWMQKNIGQESKRAAAQSHALEAQAWALAFLVEDQARMQTGFEQPYDAESADTNSRANGAASTEKEGNE